MLGEVAHMTTGFGQLLQQYRVAAGLTQELLAELAGLSTRGISDLERGVNTRPRSYTLQQLARALSLSPDDRERLEDAARVRPDATGPLEGRPTGGYLGALPSGPLIGRSAELDRLVRMVPSHSRAEGAFVLIGGEPGMGKTRLAQEIWQLLLHRQYRVAGGRCYQSESHTPYTPFYEALGSLFSALPAGGRERALAAQPELRALLPGVCEPLPEMQLDEPHLFHAVSSFLASLAAEVPTGVLLDDLHWADESSLRLLAYLVRHTRPAQLLLLGTYRTTEASLDHPLELLRISLTRESLLDHVVLEPLDWLETRQLASALLGDATIADAVARRLWSVAEGNPFYTEQVVRDAVEQGILDRFATEPDSWRVPTGVRDLVNQRLSRLDSGVQSALREASVLGQTFTFEDLQGMTSREYEDLDNALDLALGAGFIRGVGSSGYSFHAVTQRVLYESVLPHRRRRLHGAAGQAISRGREGETRRRSGEIAAHFRLAGDAHNAYRWQRMAGDEAMQMHAHAEAEDGYLACLELARACDDRPAEAAAFERLGGLYQLWADHVKAIAAYDDALRLLPPGPSVERVALFRRIAQVRAAQGLADAAEAAFGDAEAALGERQPDRSTDWDRGWIDVQADRADLLYMRGETEKLVDLVGRLRRVVDAAGTASQRIRFFDTETLVELRRERYRGSQQAVERARRFLALVESESQPSARAHSGLGFVLLWQGQLDQAALHLTTALQMAQSSGDRARQSMALAYLGVLARKQGDVQRVQTLSGELRALATASANRSYLGVAMGNQAWVHLRRREVALARTLACSALEAWGGTDLGAYPFQWLALWPLLAVDLSVGRTDAAMRAARGLLATELQPPPQELVEGLEAACARWADGDAAGGSALLGRVVTDASAGGYT
jgi:eukaryotic-like serine/threonine-protein kinase